MAVCQAKVKSVLSGDTVVLHSMHKPQLERTLSLAFVNAPRLRRDGDEPYAFESRDFLRRLLVGKVVTFRVLYTVKTTTKREYGVIILPGGPSVPELCIAEGWVKLREDAIKRDETEDLHAMVQRLKDAQSIAINENRGQYSKTREWVTTQYDIMNIQEFVDSRKGQVMEAIVEKVLSGDRLVVRLILSPTHHVQTILLIAGVRAPTTKRIDIAKGVERAAEPFAEESHNFVEVRLLQRNVSVMILGINPQDQLVGSVSHPVQGSIAPFILKEGLARCTDYHSTLLGAEMSKLRQAEKFAKENKKGLFKDHVASKNSTVEQDMIVSRIINADTLYVRTKADGERRISLSSIRQPKPSDPKQAGWSVEAKEFLRKRLIGKHVKVTFIARRPATDGFEERDMVSVTLNSKNIALLLVENGYASVIRHRADDSDRSPIYDELLRSEAAAQAEGKGMWGNKAPSIPKYMDSSESLEKAKRHLTILSRQRKIPAIVDFAKSGSRFSILIPRENARLTLVLSGIRAPRAARNPEEKSEPFGMQALDFANRRCLQRDVTLDIEDCDKVGGFIGVIWVNGENFAKILLEEGLAKVHAYSAEKSGFANEFFAAESKAKAERKGLWHDWDPSKEEERNNGRGADQEVNGTESGDGSAVNGNTEGAGTTKTEFQRVTITSFDEQDGRFKLQIIGAGTTALTSLMSSFASFHISPAGKKGLTAPPKVGELVSAKFSEDDCWYRARVRWVDREKQRADVEYIDYGNCENLVWTDLRPLSSDFNLSKLKAQAQNAKFAFIQFPGGDYTQDVTNWIQDRVCGREYIAGIEHEENVTGPGSSGGPLLYVTLYRTQCTDKGCIQKSVNAEMVEEGLAIVPKRMKGWERGYAAVFETLRTIEVVARDGRRGCWEYGDITED